MAHGMSLKSLEMRVEEAALECCKLILMGHSGYSSEDQNADRNIAGKDQAQEASAGAKNWTGCWTPDHVCDGLAENLSAFFLC